MTSWRIEFINEEAVAEFEALPMDIGTRFTRILDLFAEKGLAVLAMPVARPVTGKIWELRASGRDGIARSLYVTASGRRLVILGTFIKKTQTTPQSEIKLALKRLKEVG